MLALLSFGHMTASTMQFSSRDNILLVTSETKTSQPLFQHTFPLRRRRVAMFDFC